ncbi:GAF domain-containing protein [Pseudomonas sp. WS 5106]|uniref:GAF domain-containing protein n=1 Tax=Pseudomonas cremoris TaxID=2724178 RepID=A0A7X1AMR6_9PSED|nr:GAF domain-containing protein [Pseudomonas cremoris]MBC2381291.1 GAF domain-containing protein [Pseudomonas cremoris]MBC2407280.1 GAF domain-containing protein [Pseudomonas cremoris]
MDLIDVNLENRKIESTIISFTIYSANAWMTLIAPLIIGLLASKLYAKGDFTTGEIALYIIFGLIHLAFAAAMFYAATKKSVSIAVDEIVEENKNLKRVRIPKATRMYDTSIAQQSVIYLMTLELESLIDEMNSRPANRPMNKRLKDWTEGTERILSHLVKRRTQLFGYSNDSLYNFALYMYDASSEDLYINWRSHDDRLTPSGRRWKPGHGHVGLAFIQDQAKICADITKSSELADNNSRHNDNHNYRSFISIPIKDSCKATGGKKPLGVLVFTSSAPNQFSWQRDKFFTLTIAKLLSIHIERNIIECTGAPL